MSHIYINTTFIYSKRNIAGFELLDREDENFRKLLHYEEAIEYVKSLGGKIENAEVFIRDKNNYGKDVFDIRADKKILDNLLDRNIIFNLGVLYNEREKYYEKYKDIFSKFICVVNF